MFFELFLMQSNQYNYLYHNKILYVRVRTFRSKLQNISVHSDSYWYNIVIIEGKIVDCGWTEGQCVLL